MTFSSWVADFKYVNKKQLDNFLLNKWFTKDGPDFRKLGGRIIALYMYAVKKTKHSQQTFDNDRYKDVCLLKLIFFNKNFECSNSKYF